jgi:hypothetical protein
MKQMKVLKFRLKSHALVVRQVSPISFASTESMDAPLQLSTKKVNANRNTEASL